MTNTGRTQFKIQNESYLAEISNIGAEPIRILHKASKKELLWNGNPEYWKRHSPILFPIVGKVFDNKYRVHSKEYELTQHGFARDESWEIIEHKEEKIKLRITSNEETLIKYPFNFEIIATIYVSGKGVNIEHQVLNKGDEQMFYCLGAHPAFNTNEDVSQHSLNFEFKEHSNQLLLTPEGYRSGKKASFLENESRIELSEALFENDALIFDDLKSRYLDIVSKKDNSKIHVWWENYPHLGIWKPKNAPFICVEPWQGMADEVNFTKEFKEKYGIQILAPEEHKTYAWGCSFNE